MLGRTCVKTVLVLTAQIALSNLAEARANSGAPLIQASRSAALLALTDDEPLFFVVADQSCDSLYQSYLPNSDLREKPWLFGDDLKANPNSYVTQLYLEARASALTNGENALALSMVNCSFDPNSRRGSADVYLFSQPGENLRVSKGQQIWFDAHKFVPVPDGRPDVTAKFTLNFEISNHRITSARVDQADWRVEAKNRDAQREGARQESNRRAPEYLGPDICGSVFHRYQCSVTIE